MCSTWCAVHSPATDTVKSCFMSYFYNGLYVNIHLMQHSLSFLSVPFSYENPLFHYFHHCFIVRYRCRWFSAWITKNFRHFCNPFDQLYQKSYSFTNMIFIVDTPDMIAKKMIIRLVYGNLQCPTSVNQLCFPQSQWLLLLYIVFCS